MKYVLDASALLAFLQDEPGARVVESVLEDSGISTVNWAEVVQKAVGSGVDIDGMREELEALGVSMAPFDREQAEATGLLWKETKRHGLSLGDRACLWLGRSLGATVFTTDRVWKKLKIGVEIQILR